MSDHIVQIKNIDKSYSGRSVLKNINLSIKNGEFITFLGESGCGKTTLLRLISGFESPDAGKIIINNKDVTTEPPQKRDVHTIFQSYALFPHLTVFENVAFGLRSQKHLEQTIQDRVSDTLKIVKLQHLAHRLPAQLSGGQKQRVAIARAIINEPLVLLLDEPLSALDYRLRKTMQLELKQLQRKLGITFIFVTHDQEEALSMSDRVVVMDEGEIIQIGTPREVYEEPCNLTVGRFIGEVNEFNGIVAETNERSAIVQCDFYRFPVEHPKDHRLEKNQAVHVLVRPEDIKIWHHVNKPDVSPLISAKVIETIYKGSTVDILLQLDNQQIVTTTQFFDEDSDDENLHYQMNETIWLHWPIGWEVVLKNENIQSI